MWAKLCAALGLPETPAEGDRVEATAGDSLGLAGTVVRAQRGAMALLLDAPAPGTAFIAAEAHGEGCGISVWSYLYGPEARDLVARDLPRWQAWLGEFAGT